MKRFARWTALALILALGMAPLGMAEALEADERPVSEILADAARGEAGAAAPEGEGGVEAPPVEAEVPEVSEFDLTGEPGEQSPEPQDETEAPPERIEGGLLVSGEPELRMGLGETYALGGSVTNYQSENPAVASVDAVTGVVTGVALGSTRVTAVRRDGVIVSCVVTVLRAPDALAFAESALTLGKGERRAFAVKLPEGTASARITYASSDSGVVSVDASGNLAARKTGSAMIAARAFNGAQALCKITVLKAPSKVKLSAAKLALCVGETGALTAALPANTASTITWRSSDEGVVTVDASGRLRAVAAGAAIVRASTFNGKNADCQIRVLDGAAPTRLQLNAQALTLGVGEAFQLVPSVGVGEAALFAYASSNKKVAAVSSDGLITPKKRGTATVAVATHNGLKATVAVTVLKAPSKVLISQTALTLEEGKSAQLKAGLPSGSASSITWQSSDTSVATVDAEGYVTAVKAGKAAVRAVTFNGKTSPECAVTVTAPAPTGEDDPITVSPSAKRMGERLRAATSLGAKRDAIANVVELMVTKGFKPAFAAGVGANILAEGTYGLFESSKYISNYKKRPRYFCYLDGGEYYSNGALVAVYMSEAEMAGYTGPGEARQRFDVENYYLDNYSRRYVYEISLTDLEAFIERLDAGGWEGKFGVGIVQWTGGRTKKLVAMYRKHAGEEAQTITSAQVAAAENEMILYDFMGDYKGVYTGWKDANASRLNTLGAARSAGQLVCTRYEIPVDKETKAVARGEKAVEIFKIMMGL